MISKLRSVGYYRLCGYWYHLKDDKEHFKPGSEFERVWRAYTFDRRLRIIVMDAIERVEIAVRCEVYTELVMRHGPFVHLDPKNFPNAKPAQTDKPAQHDELLRRLREEAKRSGEPFVLHFRNKYYEHFPDMPLWAAAQIMSFGNVLTLLEMSASDIRPAIAAKFGLTDKVFKSWMLALNAVRNICAHHSRLWNRELSIKPFIPDKKNAPEWHDPKVLIYNNRIWVILSILRVLQGKIAPKSHWKTRVFELFDAFHNIPLGPMGMQTNWREHPIWK